MERERQKPSWKKTSLNAGAGRAAGQGQSPVCSGGPGGRGEK